MVSDFTIMKRSVIAARSKKSTTLKKVLRRLSHVSPGLPWQEKVQHMNAWSLCMRDSGSNTKERYDAIRGAIMRQERWRGR